MSLRLVSHIGTSCVSLLLCEWYPDNPFRAAIVCHRTIVSKYVKPKITRPVLMLGVLMPLPREIDGIEPQMPLGSAHPGLREVARRCTPLASG